MLRDLYITSLMLTTRVTIASYSLASPFTLSPSFFLVVSLFVLGEKQGQGKRFIFSAEHKIQKSQTVTFVQSFTNVSLSILTQKGKSGIAFFSGYSYILRRFLSRNSC